MREAKKSHCFEHVQRRPRETARDHSRGSSPAELTVGVDELAVGAQNGHGDGRLQEKHVVVDSMRLAARSSAFLVCSRKSFIWVSKWRRNLTDSIKMLILLLLIMVPVDYRSWTPTNHTVMILYSSSIFRFMRSTRRFSDVL